MWTRETALEIIPALEAKLSEHGAHIALGGSVLYRGTSEKDLDIIIYPHKRDDEGGWATFAIKAVLMSHFKTGLNDCEGFSQVRDDKEVAWMKLPDGRRIDFFFLK